VIEETDIEYYFQSEIDESWQNSSLVVDDDSPEATRMDNLMISDERLSNIGQRRRYTQ
jgi:hypothetical protein